jgi:hypothetical protein
MIILMSIKRKKINTTEEKHRTKRELLELKLERIATTVV